jgi:hypothetical protein
VVMASFCELGGYYDNTIGEQIIDVFSLHAVELIPLLTHEPKHLTLISASP